MALVRVYYGLAAAEPKRQAGSTVTSLTVAIVDEAGRVLDICDVADDPQGYAYLSTLLAERASGPYSVAIAADGDQHLLCRLLTAAGWAVVFTDSPTTDDYADRFADEFADAETTTRSQRRALGLARALHAGTLTATILPPPPELADLKPVLSADRALANGRYAAAGALREVLRELYPAALRAYADPADPVALAVMDALPEPSMLADAGAGVNGGRRRDTTAGVDAITARVADSGVADVATVGEAVTALHVAIAETPRRNGLSRSLASAVADTVRRSVAAVRACDDARTVLITTLAERVQEQATVHTAPAPTPVPAPATPVAPVAQAPAAAPSDSRPVSSPPPPPPGITPITEPRPTRSRRRAEAEQPAAAATDVSVADVRVPAPRPAVEGPPPGSRGEWPTSPPADDWAVAASPGHDWSAPAGANGPPAPDPWDRHRPAAETPAGPPPITPPWQDDTLQPPEPPPLRLVEPAVTGESTSSFGYQGWSSEPPPLRLVAPDPNLPRSAPPVGSEDDDLLIFSQARSAWFDHDAEESSWQSPVDDAWQAATHAARPEIGNQTDAGLPRRVPHANLIPGSVPSERERPLRVVRDPATIAAHTSGYFNGWRRGQEVGGYPLGTRASRASAGAWDFARDPHAS